MKVKKKDIVFEVTCQLQPAEGVDYNELIVVDGEYNLGLGWVNNISRVGVLKYNSENESYKLENFGTGW